MRRRASATASLSAILLLGAAVIVFPALAGSETTPTVDAVATPGNGEHEFGWSPEAVTVAAGTSVTFANTTPEIPHGIKWTSAIKPTCEKSVPVDEEREGWSGSCTFTQPGTYTFRCTVHAYMVGKILVGADGATTTTTTSRTQSSAPAEVGSSPKGSDEPGPEGGTSTGISFKALILPRHQHGSSVHGRADVLPAGAGGRLTVELFARVPSPKKHGSSRSVIVGRVVRGSLKAGELPFVVRLNAAGRRALLPRHSLALTAKISLASREGRTTVMTRKIALHS